MLFVRPKIADLGLRLFGRSVHPELFEVCVSRTVERQHYLLEVQITTAGHLAAFRHGDQVLTEVCAGVHQTLPSYGRLVETSIDGDSDEREASLGSLHWRSFSQYENVPPKMFLSIQQQFANQGEFIGLAHQFQSSGRVVFGGISYLNIQAFAHKVFLRAFHTFPDSCAIVKTHSIFELRTGKE